MNKKVKLIEIIPTQSNVNCFKKLKIKQKNGSKLPILNFIFDKIVNDILFERFYLSKTLRNLVKISTSSKVTLQIARRNK